jgi:acyl-CoA hydrolase
MTAANETCLVDLVFPGETNHHGTLFGGEALAYMDKLAFIVAARHAHCDFVTASCERIDFAQPARLSEIIEARGRVVHVGVRSLTVETDLVAEELKSGERRLCTRGRFNLVTSERTHAGLPPLPGAPLAPADPSAPAHADVRMVELIFPNQCSHREVLFGGYALAAMGKAAFVAATRLCRKSVVMAASRRMDFVAPVHVGEIMELTASIMRAGSSSMEVSVSASGENLQSGARWKVADGSFVMVAVDADGRPTRIAA